MGYNYSLFAILPGVSGVYPDADNSVCSKKKCSLSDVSSLLPLEKRLHRLLLTSIHAATLLLLQHPFRRLRLQSHSVSWVSTLTLAIFAFA